MHVRRAHGTGRSPKLLTIVARVCPTYQDVMANLARNDIQESLQDLGKNTVYSAGQPIDPAIEAREQPNCKPLPDWTFTLGTGYQSRAVSGTWGSLSIVTGAFSTSLVTQDETALLNDQGQTTGDQIEGAATIELTPEQADIAARPDALWIQGGTTTDPVLDKTYPGQYGFAALRCAIDNLNGDNVEWIGYPSGASHVFCYAYYVKPPPTSGTIIVTKTVSSPRDATHTFSFGGNISFNADGTFDLAVQNGAPASMTFYRAETGPNDQPWTVQELVPPGWVLSEPDLHLADGQEHDDDRDSDGLDQARGRGHGDVHLHRRPDAAAGCAQPDEDDDRRRRQLRLHGHPGGGRSLDSARPPPRPDPASRSRRRPRRSRSPRGSTRSPSPCPPRAAETGR